MNAKELLLDLAFGGELHEEAWQELIERAKTQSS